MTTLLLDLISYDNEVLRNCAFWTAILLLKTVLMSFLSSGQLRITRLTQTLRAGETWESQAAANADRVRRCHHNDLENVIPLCLSMAAYVLTDPQPAVAINLFRVLVAFRLWHTLVYAIYEIRQPARYVGFLVPWCIMVYMIVAVAIRFA